jgi:hypothetical protein
LCELSEWDEFHAIIKVNVTSARHPVQLLRLSGTHISILTELARVGLFAMDE